MFVQVFLKLRATETSGHTIACLLGPMNNICEDVLNPVLISPFPQNIAEQHGTCLPYATPVTASLSLLPQFYQPLRKAWNVWVGSLLWEM